MCGLHRHADLTTIEFFFPHNAASVFAGVHRGEGTSLPFPRDTGQRLASPKGMQGARKDPASITQTVEVRL